MRLSNHQLQTVEKALFEVAREQKSSAKPVELPLPDFWASVGQLTAHLEAELADTVRAEGMTAKAQQHLSVIDWERHDPSERAYYQSLSHLVDKYKHDVAWKELVNGNNGGNGHGLPFASPGPNASLSEFSDPASATPEAAAMPAVAPSPTASPTTVPVSDTRDSWGDPDFDEEDRIRAMDAYPDRATGADPHPPSEISVVETLGGDLMRIRILKDLSDPIIGEDGSEMNLAEGDVESCPILIAETLIAAGLAVAAPL